MPPQAGLRCLHLDPDKAAILARLAPAIPPDGAEPGHVVDPGLVAAILGSRDFAVLPIAENHGTLGRRTGLDFSAAEAVTAAMPTFLEGPRHRALRAAMAGFLATRRAAQAAALEAALGDRLDALLRPGCEADLMADLTTPLWRAVSRPLLEDEPEAHVLGESFAVLIDPAASLNRRLAASHRLGAALAAAAGCPASLPAATKIALLMTGREPFAGSLALALWLTLARHPGIPLAAIPWPARLPATSLPFFDRVALGDWERGGYRVPAGARVRLHLEALAGYGPLPTGDVLFGRGRHACLGRALSELAWTRLTGRLGACPLRAEAVELALRPGDSLFCLPVVARIRLGA